MKAFPSDKSEIDVYGIKQPMGKNEGMDLRDYFAAKVIIRGAFTYSTNKYDKETAKRAYEIADAMMEARNERK